MDTRSGGAYYDPSLATPAIEAVRHMGTNALPFLMNDFQAKDGLFWRNVPGSFYPLGFVRWLRRMSGPSSWERHDRAIYFLQALGPLAKPAIPALSACLDQPDLAQPAVDILGFSDSRGRVSLGPEATPALLKAMANTNDTVRQIAANALGLIGSDPDRVVPALIHALKDPSRDVRGAAARSFGGYKTQFAIIIPALLPVLDDPDPYVRQGATWMLGRFRKDAAVAVPKLLVLLNDPDIQVRTSATNALQLIDPETAAKAAPQTPPPAR